MIKKIDISYDVWKTLVDNNNWTTYHLNNGVGRDIYSGCVDFLIRSSVRRDSYDVWTVDFPNSTLKEQEDDIIASIIQERYDDLRNSATVYKDGETVQSDDKNYLISGKDVNNIIRPLNVRPSGGVIGGQYDTRLSTWDLAPMNIGDSWETVYTLSTTNSVFYGAIFQTNCDHMLFRLYINGELSMSVDLGELSSDYKLGHGGGKNDATYSKWPLSSYFINRWILKPNPILVNSSVYIQLKLDYHNSNKRLERGLTWWGI